MNDSSVEAQLRALHWRAADADSLQRSLDAAMEANQKRPALLPPLLRWALAAVWMLIAFFKFTKPETVSEEQRASFAKLSPLSAEIMLAEMQLRRDLTEQQVLELMQHSPLTPPPLP